MNRLALLAVVTFVAAFAGCSHQVPRTARPAEPPTTFPMPQLRGLTVEQAEARLHDAGNRGAVDWREQRCDTALPAGAVCSTYPWPGAHAMPRESLIVYVQAPAGATAAVPDVEGQPVEAARVALQQAGFRVIVRTVDDPHCTPSVVCHVGSKRGHTGIPKTLYVGSAIPPPSPAPPRQPAPAAKAAPNKPPFFK
jgi:hypothetical protein